MEILSIVSCNVHVHGVLSKQFRCIIIIGLIFFSFLIDLLEKNRVIHQNNNERSFHVFYQLLAGAPQTFLGSLIYIYGVTVCLEG